jgi:hypothetical protein
MVYTVHISDQGVGVHIYIYMNIDIYIYIYVRKNTACCNPYCPRFLLEPCGFLTLVTSSCDPAATFQMTTVLEGGRHLSNMSFQVKTSKKCCPSYFTNVNPGLINHGLLIRGYSPNSHNLILKWYPSN